MLAVGAPEGTGVAGPIRVYEERAGRYFTLEVSELPAAPGRLRAEQALRREGETLMERLPDDAEIFALSREGKGISSRGLASYLDRLATYGRAGAVFVVGGAHGLGPRVLQAADRKLSLSPMTLPHGLARLVLMEQIYRAGTILRNEPYHRGA